MCLGPLPHLGDLVKVSAGQRDAIKDHVYCSEICSGAKRQQQAETSSPSNDLLQLVVNRDTSDVKRYKV